MAFGAHGAQEGHRQGAGARTSLQHAGAHENIALDQDLRGVLGINNGGAARHREDVIHHEVAEEQEGRAQGGLDDGTFIHPHDVIVVDYAFMGMELASFFQNDRVVAPLGVRQLHAVAIGKGARISHAAKLLEVVGTNPSSMPQEPARAIFGPARPPSRARSASKASERPRRRCRYPAALR